MLRNMNKVILALLIVCVMAPMAFAKQPDKDYVEVIYFHGKQRCPTCIAIGKNTRMVIDSDFAKHKKSGKVKFRIIDISTADGEREAKKYRVSWSSLFVNRVKNGDTTVNNLTQEAFKTARAHSDVFRQELKEAINEALK